jgi:hypothetical protein
VESNVADMMRMELASRLRHDTKCQTAAVPVHRSLPSVCRARIWSSSEPVSQVDGVGIAQRVDDV